MDVPMRAPLATLALAVSLAFGLDVVSASGAGLGSNVAIGDFAAKSGPRASFSGTVKSRKRACTRRRKVRVFQKAAGADLQFGADTTNRRGKWTAKGADPPAGKQRFYAKLRRKLSRSFNCRGARSKTFRPCSLLTPDQGFDNGEWTIRKQDASIPEGPFEARIDGVSIGQTRLLAFASRVEGTERFPQVFVLASSGYLRMKSGADPDPALPFGQSLVLGPAIYGTSASFPTTQLFFNPQLQRVDVDTSNLRRDCTGRLVLHATADDASLPPGDIHTNQVMNLDWDLTLHEPTDEQTRIDISGEYAFSEQVQPDPVRTAELQSFRLVQVSSMFIDTASHDVDAFRFRAPSGPVEVALSPALASTLLPTVPSSLETATPVLDSIHTDDVGQPNGNTPSYRISVEGSSGPASGPLTPRAFFTGSLNPNDDNLGLWLHQQPSAVIDTGTAGTTDLRIVATEDPPAPP